MEKYSDKYFELLKELGFGYDMKYNMRTLKDVGGWITNVNKDDFDPSNITPGSLVDSYIKDGGVIVTNIPLPLENGVTLSNQVGIYCVNYQETMDNRYQKQSISNVGVSK